MQPGITYPEVGGIGVLLRGVPASVRAWTEKWNAGRLGLSVVTILAGAGLYGAAMGSWRDSRQALFVAIKFPAIILLTAFGNALLNAMLAPLMGINLGLRQSFLAILASFTIAAAILGSFSPLAAFVVWNAPPMSSGAYLSGMAYNGILLMHVAVIAFAGIVANLRLVALLRELSGSVSASRRVLFSWLAGNLFLGSQLSWILRPFIGSPMLAVEFFRDDAFHGSFYETVFRSILHLLNAN